MVFYALVAADSSFAIDLYPTREQAEHALHDVLADEPEFAALLALVPIDLTGASCEN